MIVLGNIPHDRPAPTPTTHTPQTWGFKVFLRFTGSWSSEEQASYAGTALQAVSFTDVTGEGVDVANRQSGWALPCPPATSSEPLLQLPPAPTVSVGRLSTRTAMFTPVALPISKRGLSLAKQNNGKRKVVLKLKKNTGLFQALTTNPNLTTMGS